MGRARGHSTPVSANTFASVLGIRRGVVATPLTSERICELTEQVRHGQLSEALTVLGEHGGSTTRVLHDEVCALLTRRAKATVPARLINRLFDAAALTPRLSETLFYQTPWPDQGPAVVHICPQAGKQLHGERWREVFSSGETKTICGKKIKGTTSPLRTFERAPRGVFSEGGRNPHFELVPCLECTRLAGESVEAREQLRDLDLDPSIYDEVFAAAKRRVAVTLDEFLAGRGKVDVSELTQVTAAKLCYTPALREIVEARLRAGGEAALRELVGHYDYDDLNDRLIAAGHPQANNLCSFVTDGVYKGAFWSFMSGGSEDSFRSPFFVNVIMANTQLEQPRPKSRRPRILGR